VKRNRVEKTSRGQALLETALVLPFLLMLIVGIIEFGVLFVQYFGLLYTTDHVTMAAARLGGDGPELDVVQRDNRLPFIDPAQITRSVSILDTSGAVVCSTGTCACAYGQVARVSMTHPAKLSIPFVATWNLVLSVQESQVCWRGGAP
jgi:Flp pilus assembly protein TadG